MYTDRPTYAWSEIKNIGTNMNFTRDDQTIQIVLPAGFGPLKFYGQRYDSISVCINGWIGAGTTTSTAYQNTNIPNTQAPNAVIYANWDDLYPEVNNNVWYLFDTIGRRLIIEWDSVRYYSPSTMRDKFQVIIYDTTRITPTGDNEIVVQYKTANNYESVTMGIEDQTGTIGIQCLYNGTYHPAAAQLVPGSAIKYTTANPIIGISDELTTTNLGKRMQLYPSRPNPFTNHTMISYNIAHRGNVAVEIYDAAGRLVKTLVNGEQNIGSYTLQWNGKDEKGNRVAQGIYFCQLKTDNTTAVRKLAIIK
jgi:hypothetical protein